MYRAQRRHFCWAWPSVGKEKASRNSQVDQTFNPDDYQELRMHLECIILLRPTDDALFHQIESGEYVAKLDNSKLSDIQQRLIEANLRRRHKFLGAQKRSSIQKRLKTHFSLSAAPSSIDSPLQEEPLTDIQNADAADNLDPKPDPTTKGEQTTAISGFSLASTAEGILKHGSAAKKYTPSATKTQITFIASDVEFPKAPPISPGREIKQCPCCCQSLLIKAFQNPNIWK